MGDATDALHVCARAGPIRRVIVLASGRGRSLTRTGPIDNLQSGCSVDIKHCGCDLRLGCRVEDPARRLWEGMRMYLKLHAVYGVWIVQK